MASATAVLLALAACGSTEEPTDGTPPPAAQTTDEVTDEPTEEPTEDPAEEPTEDPAEEPTEEPTDGDATDAEDSGEVVELRDGSVAGIELPADGDELRQALVAEIGEPDDANERRACPGLGEGGTLRELTWGDFTVYGQAARGEEFRIQTWKVIGNDIPEDLDLPFDIIPGTPWDVALGAIPAAEVGTAPLDETPAISSPEREGMVWIGDDAGSEITVISFGEQTCA